MNSADQVKAINLVRSIIGTVSTVASFVPAAAPILIPIALAVEGILDITSEIIADQALAADAAKARMVVVIGSLVDDLASVRADVLADNEAAVREAAASVGNVVDTTGMPTRTP